MSSINLKKLSFSQIQGIASSLSSRFSFTNHNTYFRCIDREAKDKRETAKSFYRFHDAVKAAYLEITGENALYFDWQTAGMEVSLARKNYLNSLAYEIVSILCGFESPAKIHIMGGTFVSLMSVDDLEKSGLINPDLFNLEVMSLYGIKDQSAREMFVSAVELTDVLGEELMRKVQCEVVTCIVDAELVLSHKPYHSDFLSQQMAVKS